MLTKLNIFSTSVVALVATATQADVSIDQTFMDEIYTSVRLSVLTSEPDLVGNEQSFLSQENLDTLTAYKRYKNGVVIDQALVAKANGVCYGVFRGVDNLADFGQSVLYLGSVGGVCYAREGYHDAYVNEYQDAFEDDLDICIASCSGGDCPLILSGHSQGGAVAVVASIFWSHKNPKVITFGAPPAVQEPCLAINANNHFRFIAANNDNLGMWYDPIVLQAGSVEVHLGRSIILGSNLAALHQPASPGLNDNRDRHPVDATFAAHRSSNYLTRVEAMRNTSPNFPIQAIGFQNDVQCGFNDECESGRCEGAFPPYKCRAKEGSCGLCNENSDCASGICLVKSFQSVCAEPDGKMADSCYCDLNSDCQSGRCEGSFPPFQCHAKLGRGASCNEDEDCHSNNCSFSWSSFAWQCA